MSPRFSLVTAAYDVSPYLDDFIDSLERQRLDPAAFEVIVVDDGSRDDTLDRLRAWEADTRLDVRVLTQANGGQASARNLGLREVRGEWVTFPDPDDRVTRGYLARVARFLDQHPETHMVGARRVVLDHRTGSLLDRHPLRAHFLEGDVLRDLTQQPDYFYSSAPAAFFRVDRVRELGLEFPLDIRPNFEDGYFCARYLLAEERPLVGFVRSAAYHYRKRRDGSSTLERAKGDPHRYTTVLERGYLPLFAAAREHHGEIPGWLQSLIFYELSWLFSVQDTITGASRAQRGEVADRFHALVASIAEQIDPDILDSSATRPMRPSWRDILAHGYRDEPWAAADGAVDVDLGSGLARVRYHYTHEPPDELVLSGGVQVQPLHHKIRDISYHDRTLLHERIIWVPADKSLRVRVAGRDLQLHDHRVRPRKRFLRKDELRVLGGGDAGASHTEAEERLLAKAGSARVRRAFADAWVLMDRVHDAGDSAEQLFEHLRRHRRDVNAWFVVERDTEDWKRLRRSHGRRVVAHGSDRWVQLMLNCRHLVSSHADDPIVAPERVLRLADPQWRFTFLQHGVIKDDLSVWLNHKPIDVFVTSTQAEHDSIVGDHTSYVFTTKEVVLAGLPRFDRLRTVGLEHPEDDRDLLLAVPTWRQWLTSTSDPASQRHRAEQGLLESDFIRQWVAYLGSPELHAAAEAAGLTIAFLPHPNLQTVLDELELPSHVRRLSYDGADVKEYFARAALLVTDYSSVAFNAAYIDRPVLYFQFDRDRMFGGQHVGAAGYFSYERDGFGPVVERLEDAVATSVAMVREGKHPAPQYQQRTAATFPARDGHCCERVVAAIEALDEHYGATDAR